MLQTLHSKLFAHNIVRCLGLMIHVYIFRFLINHFKYTLDCQNDFSFREIYNQISIHIFIVDITYNFIMINNVALLVL